MPKKLLLIDDDPVLMGLMKNRLLKDGYNVLNASDGETGLVYIKQERPDLVMLDLILPRIDGFEILKLVKKDKSLSNIPMVVFSNLNEPGDIDRCMNLGARDYIIKAMFTSEEIAEKIKDIVYE